MGVEGSGFALGEFLNFHRPQFLHLENEATENNLAGQFQWIDGTEHHAGT